MWRRLALTRLQALATELPAVLVLGPREVGKTTLARAAFRQLPYVNLEEAHTRARFRQAAARELERLAAPALILDQVHAVPELFAALAGIIAARDAPPGRFILLGSAQPALDRAVTEALGRRMAVLDLEPLTAIEVARGKSRHPFTDVWLRGGFPDALESEDFHAWWEVYLHGYLEHHLPALGASTDASLMRRLLTMLAHNQGGILNLSQLGAALGVSLPTVQHHLDVLEQTYLLRRLPAYGSEAGPRTPQGPKLYLRDTGLLHHLLGLEVREALASHPIASVSWETFVLEDLARRERLAHPGSRFFYFRTGSGAEVDLVIERGADRFAIEIKSSRADKPLAIDALETAAEALGARHAYFIDPDKGRGQVRAGIERLGFAEALDWLPG
jgi:predicted AAA+ superfamily ATPase